VLTRIEEEKRQTQEQANIEKILMPIVSALSAELPKVQNKYVGLLRTNLEEIAAPFISQLSHQHQSLTLTEVKTCK
jgi:hypothetical protein